MGGVNEVLGALTIGEFCARAIREPALEEHDERLLGLLDDLHATVMDARTEWPSDLPADALDRRVRKLASHRFKSRERTVRVLSLALAMAEDCLEGLRATRCKRRFESRRRARVAAMERLLASLQAVHADVDPDMDQTADYDAATEDFELWRVV